MAACRSADVRFLPVALRLIGKRALVVGGDREAYDKTLRLLAAGADVTVIEPETSAELLGLARRGVIRWYARPVDDRDLAGTALVLLTRRDPALARHLQHMARAKRYWFCAIDQPEYCDFVQVAAVDIGPLTVAFSSGGRAPGVLKRIKQGLEAGFDSDFVAFVDEMIQLREALGTLSSAERREALRQALEGFRVEVNVSYPSARIAGEDPAG